MRQYHDLLRAVLVDGNDRGSRAGGTRSTFGLQFRHNLAEGFPLLTTKKLNWKAIVVELLWFLKGDTNIRYLLENDVHIWTDDAYRMYKRRVSDSGLPIITKESFEHAILTDESFAQTFGDLGPVYGKQWRAWRNEYTDIPIDQIKNVIESIKSNPEGRRHIVTAWNPAEVDSMALPPCHCLYQFYVNNGKLSCHLYQRSADLFLGVPFNIASYALLTHIIAHQTGLDVGDLIISFGDIHIYNQHMAAVDVQLSRECKRLPTLRIDPQFRDNPNEVLDPAGYMLGDFILDGYDPHPAIKGELSVGV